MKIKCRLGELLEERGIMKKYIADKLEVQPQTVSAWVHNNHFIPMDKAFRVAKLLNVKVDDLYEEES